MLRITKTENGTVRGTPAADARITVFKGIPFAAPPVGPLRWRAPQPAANWKGVRSCLEFMPIAMQRVPGANPNTGAFYAREWHVDPEVAMDEDCLYLNIWTNAKTGKEKMPVMVWIYGGGLRKATRGKWSLMGNVLRGAMLSWFPLTTALTSSVF